MTGPILFVGLGNPGPRFHGTRHNVGFDVVEALSVHVGIPLRKPWFRAVRWAGPSSNPSRLAVALPQTFMNKSGDVVPWVRKRAGVPLERTVVVVDNMDLPPGEIRMKRRGGTAGHNGLKSVTAAVGGDDYPRVYVGVGRPAEGVGTIDHVLGRFGDGDRSLVDDAVTRIVPVLAAGADREIEQLISDVNARRRGG